MLTLFYGLLLLVIKTIVTEAFKPFGKLIYQMYLKELTKKTIKKVTALVAKVNSNFKK